MDNESQTSASFLRRHPRLALLFVNLALLAAVFVSLEIVLRFVISYNPGYYMSVDGTDQEVQYPYGTIYINSHGFPDTEFDLSRDQRVGYFGDSVTYGVGAGYGYRFTELLEEAYPAYEHMNFGGIGLTLSENEIRSIVGIVEKFDLDEAVYFFNLNDIIPTDQATPEASSVNGADLVSLRGYVNRYLDWMRGRSYLYTWVRTRIKTLLEAYGVGFHGYPAYELFPGRHEDAFRDTAERINELREALGRMGVGFAVVLLPYEMQISDEAAQVYAGHGIRWEDGFLEGRAQHTMTRFLDDALLLVDARHAFLDGEKRSRRTNGVGEYFVYDRGDKLDWNHPNRMGHEAIAAYLVQQGLLGPGEPDRAAGSGPGSSTSLE